MLAKRANQRRAWQSSWRAHHEFEVTCQEFQRSLTKTATSRLNMAIYYRPRRFVLLYQHYINVRCLVYSAKRRHVQIFDKASIGSGKQVSLFSISLFYRSMCSMSVLSLNGESGNIKKATCRANVAIFLSSPPNRVCYLGMVRGQNSTAPSSHLPILLQPHPTANTAGSPKF